MPYLGIFGLKFENIIVIFEIHENWHKNWHESGPKIMLHLHENSVLV